MSDREELVKRLRAKKKAAGFKSGLSEDGGHRVAEMQYVPDPDAQEAATLIATLAAEKEALEADAKDYCALMEKRDAEFVRAEAAEARVRELEAALIGCPGVGVGSLRLKISRAIQARRDALTKENGE